MLKSLRSQKIIAIIGLMGVGKTTLGNKLAERLGYYFVDSDLEIEDREGRSITQIFAIEGEKYFREVEKKVIQEIVAREEQVVLSLGGGAFINDEIREVLQKKAIVIWLEAPLEVILHRLSGKTNRPLLNNKNKREVLEELAQKRYPIYAEADLKVETNNGGHEGSISKIVNFIKSLGN